MVGTPSLKAVAGEVSGKSSTFSLFEKHWAHLEAAQFWHWAVFTFFYSLRNLCSFNTELKLGKSKDKASC